VKIKDDGTKQVNVLLTGLEYNALAILGGPTAILKAEIEEKAGDKFKLKRLRQQIVDSIAKEQQRLRDVDRLIKEYEEKEAEEKKRLAEEAVKKKNNIMENKHNNKNKKTLSNEEWFTRWIPEFRQRLTEKGELSELEYAAIYKRTGFTTREEVHRWLRDLFEPADCS